MTVLRMLVPKGGHALGHFELPSHGSFRAYLLETTQFASSNTITYMGTIKAWTDQLWRRRIHRDEPLTAVRYWSG